jgi:hypothetical protein
MNIPTPVTVDRRTHLKIVVLALLLGVLTLALTGICSRVSNGLPNTKAVFKAPAAMTPTGLTESVVR